MLLSACRAEGVLTEAAPEAVPGCVLSLTAGVAEVGAAVMQAYLSAMNDDRLGSYHQHLGHFWVKMSDNTHFLQEEDETFILF